MRQQLHDWRILVDHIIDKVWEYIDEIDYWTVGTLLWVDAENDTIALDDEGKQLAGESRPVEQFIVTEEDGSRHPDVDAIEEFAYGWFDFRQA